MGKQIIIEENELEDILKLCSSKLMGKVMKRFEIVQDVNVLKLEVKELIYEGYRDFRDILLASNRGHSVSIYKFKTKSKAE